MNGSVRPRELNIPLDTGSQLRSLYESEGGVKEIFSSKVADYVASRPDYPPALFDFLRAECNLRQGATVTDVGAGTGLLTHGLLSHGYSVVAIEPSSDMRAAADHLLTRFPGYRSAGGTAESIPLPSSSLDLITAAQAFHWFEIESARAEFLRILRPHGKVALIWNDRVLADPLHVALNELFAQYGGVKRSALIAHQERGDVPKFFGGTVPVEMTWQHEHCLSELGILSLVFSRSYMPERNSPIGQEACRHVQQIFQRFAQDGQLPVRYTTIAIVGRPHEAEV